ncbi:MAG: diacylglycerol/lipid kinase family protein [Bradymonadia bacterium]|jgi:YegS/Rv2252/BmrU family lipid kinase
MSEPVSTFVCVNPASANGRTGARWSQYAQALRAEVGEFTVGFTQAPREAGQLVRRALESGMTRVVSVGGDGTHNEVIQGFFRPDAVGVPVSPEASLHVVPAGTGGDFRRSLGLGAETLDAIRQIRGETIRADVGHLTYTRPGGGSAQAYFINIASFGMSGLVDRIVNESSKALGGKMSFLLGVGRASLRYKNQRVRLRVDDGEPLDRTVNNVAVANARYYGGGMKIAPGADLSDGLFDVVVVGDLGTLEMARGVGRIYAGQHLDMPKVEVLRGRRVTAEPWEPGTEVLIDMDGEQPGMLPAAFTLMPGALRLGVGRDR